MLARKTRAVALILVSLLPLATVFPLVECFPPPLTVEPKTGLEGFQLEIHGNVTFLELGANDSLLAFLLEGPNSTTQLWLARTDGRKALRIDVKDGWTSAPSFSPDGDKIAFLLHRGDSVLPAIYDVSSGSVKEIESQRSERVTWNPNGGSIAFDDLATGRIETYDIATDLISAVPLNMTAKHPVYSDDGRALFFAGLSRDSYDIWSLRLDGGELRRLTYTIGDDFMPQPSPDGNSILFLSTYLGLTDIWLMDSRGDNAEPLVDPPEIFNQELLFPPIPRTCSGSLPTWSPDGKSILYTAEPAASGGNMYVVLVNQSVTYPSQMGENYVTLNVYTKLEAINETVLCPRYSKDGSFIVFICWREGAWTVAILRFEPSNLTPHLGYGG